MKTKILPLLLTLLGSFAFASDTLEICRGSSGLVGFCKNGEVVIDQQFFDASDFIDGHAAVLKDDKWGIINENGHFIVEPIFDEVYNCTNAPDQILVRTGNKWHFINSYGIQMSKEYEVPFPWYEFELEGTVASFNPDTWFSFQRKGKWGIVDIHDEIKMPFDYEWTRVVRSGKKSGKDVVSIILKQKGKFAWQGINAQAATGFEFDAYLGEYGDQLFFQKGDKVETVNSLSGARNETLDRQYFNLIDAEDSVGLVSASGNIVLPFNNQMVNLGIVPEHAVFGQKGNVGLANLKGDILLEKEYYDVKFIRDNLIAVKNQEMKTAVIKIAGNKTEFITPFKYDYAVLDEDRIRMKMGQRFGVISFTGIETWQN